MTLRADNVSWSADGKLIVDRVSLRVEPGSTVGLLGPNGSGKSSSLRLLAGLRCPDGGQITVAGREITRWQRCVFACRVAVVEQEVSTEVDLTVEEDVALGRIPHRATWGSATDLDRAAVARALRHTGLEPLSRRRWHSLSGGERQRTQIARALAQDPSELLLDEPTNHLDTAHQLGLLDLVRTLPITSIVCLHDLNLAAAYCDRVVVLSDGQAVAEGPPAQVGTPVCAGTHLSRCYRQEPRRGRRSHLRRRAPGRRSCSLDHQADRGPVRETLTLPHRLRSRIRHRRTRRGFRRSGCLAADSPGAERPAHPASGCHPRSPPLRLRQGHPRCHERPQLPRG